MKLPTGWLTRAYVWAEACGTDGVDVLAARGRPLDDVARVRSPWQVPSVVDDVVATETEVRAVDVSDDDGGSVQ